MVFQLGMFLVEVAPAWQPPADGCSGWWCWQVVAITDTMGRPLRGWATSGPRLWAHHELVLEAEAEAAKLAPAATRARLGSLACWRPVPPDGVPV